MTSCNIVCISAAAVVLKFNLRTTCAGLTIDKSNCRYRGNE